MASPNVERAHDVSKAFKVCKIVVKTTSAVAASWFVYKTLITTQLGFASLHSRKLWINLDTAFDPIVQRLVFSCLFYKLGL